jgi:hypothetical protein
MDPVVPVGRWSQPSGSAAASGSIRCVREHRDVVTVPIRWRWRWTSGRTAAAGEAARCGRESVDGGRFLLRFEDMGCVYFIKKNVQTKDSPSHQICDTCMEY